MLLIDSVRILSWGESSIAFYRVLLVIWQLLANVLDSQIFELLSLFLTFKTAHFLPGLCHQVNLLLNYARFFYFIGILLILKQGPQGLEIIQRVGTSDLLLIRIFLLRGIKLMEILGGSPCTLDCWNRIKINILGWLGHSAITLIIQVDQITLLNDVWLRLCDQISIITIHDDRHNGVQMIL